MTTARGAESGTAVPPIVIREALTAADERLVTMIRHEVFTLEQRLTDVVDEDIFDHGAGAVVLLAFADGTPVGTGRLHVSRREGQIAWVAVRRPYRGQGVGWELMEALLAAAGERGARRVTLSAQTHALGFYTLFGFRSVGSPYTIASIEHITMVRDLGD